MVDAILAYKDLPAEVTDPLRQLFEWLLWVVEAGLIARLTWVGGRVGWEFFHPPPGPPASPADIVRTLTAWIFASVAWPVAAAMLIEQTF